MPGPHALDRAARPSTPITESCGPVMPASVIAAVPPGEHARVVRLHVRVRAEDGGHAPVEVARQRDLLARRLGVEVDDDDRRLALRLLDEPVDDDERRSRTGAVNRSPSRLITATRPVTLRSPSSRARATSGQVRRPEHAVGVRTGRREVSRRRQTWFPSVITSAPAGEQRVGDLRRDPEPVGGVLAVHDARSPARARRAARGCRSSTARRPGRPFTSATKRIFRA